MKILRFAVGNACKRVASGGREDEAGHPDLSEKEPHEFVEITSAPLLIDQRREKLRGRRKFFFGTESKVASRPRR